MGTRSTASKAPSSHSLDLSLSSYTAVELRDVRTRKDDTASVLIYRNPFNGKTFSHDENYTKFHGRPGHARKVETQFGKARITVEFSNGDSVTAVREAFIPYSKDLLPVITAAHTETKSAYDQAKNPLQAWGRWISVMAEFVSPTPRSTALAAEAELPF